MSLMRRDVRRLTRVVVLSLLALLVPIQSANAGASFGTATAVHPTALTKSNFSSMQGNLDGSILVAAAGYSYLIRSTDSGTTWSIIASAGIKDWYSVAINDSGTVIAAAEASGSIWISTNSGTSWVQQTSTVPTNTTWYGLDMNASGSIIVAGNQSNTVYVTTNTGSTWTARSASTASASRGIAISADGAKMVLYSYGDLSLYTSSDTGTTWVKQVNAGQTAVGVMMPWISRDGQRILYGKFLNSNATHLGVSQNFGASWETITAASVSMVAIGASDDLTKLWTAPNGSSTYASINSGASWTTSATSTGTRFMYINPTGTRWVSAASIYGIFTSDGIPSTMTLRQLNLGVSNWGRSATSTNGTVMIAASASGDVNVSRDSGATWSSVSYLGTNNSWSCIAVSGDGNVMYAGGLASRLYKSTDKGINWAPLSGGTLTTGSININGCATNSDGSKVAFIYGGSGIHISTNSGSTFALSQANSICTSTNEFYAITMTIDGSKLAAVCNAMNTYIYVSTNGGTTWGATSATTPRFFKDIKCSADGSVLIALVGDSYQPFLSTDWGANWKRLAGIGTSFSTALSINSDGTLIVIGQTTSSGKLYYSLNKGDTFTQVPGSLIGNHTIAAISGDSTNLLFGVDGRQLQTMSVSLVFVTASFSGISLNGAAAYRSSVVITATIGSAGADGKVTFYANGKKIPGCIRVASASLVATCTWKPSSRGAVTISAIAYPSDSSFLSGITSIPVTVSNRSGLR